MSGIRISFLSATEVEEPRCGWRTSQMGRYSESAWCCVDDREQRREPGGPLTTPTHERPAREGKSRHCCLSHMDTVEAWSLRYQTRGQPLNLQLPGQIPGLLHISTAVSQRCPRPCPERASLINLISTPRPCTFISAE